MPRFKPYQVVTWIVALLLAVWILKQLPLSTLSQSMSALSPTQWTTWITLNLIIILLFVGRWRVLVKAMNLPVGFFRLLQIRQAGQVISFVTPGPQFGGEPLQVYWLWKIYSQPGHSALLAVGLDRFYELWINFAVLLFAVLLLLASPVVDFLNWREIALVLMILVLALSIMGWLLLRQPGQVFRWIKRLTVRWQHHSSLRKLDAHWTLLSDSLRDLVEKRKPGLLLAVILSLLGWVGIMAELWLLLAFFNISPGFFDFVFLIVAIRLAFLLPFPGGIGTFEAALFWAFQGLSLPLAAAAGLIILMRLRDAVILALGLVALHHIHSHQSLAGGET